MVCLVLLRGEPVIGWYTNQTFWKIANTKLGLRARTPVYWIVGLEKKLCFSTSARDRKPAELELAPGTHYP